MSETAPPRRTAHAEPDLLECSAPSGVPKSIPIAILAKNFLAGELTSEAITSRCARALGRPWPWLGPLAERYVARLSGAVRPRRRDVAQFLRRDRQLALAWAKHSPELSIQNWISEPQRMRPAEPATNWDVPLIETLGALADWLWLEPEQLDWFADLKGLGCRSSIEQLRNYHLGIAIKRSGRVRLIEAPKRHLKRIQRQILSDILEKIPVHGGVHGFVKGRSIQSFAAPHVGKAVVLRLDLEEFFPSFPGARVQALFRTIGYPESVADVLGGICTNAVPAHAWRDVQDKVDPEQLHRIKTVYSRPHLPQGAPTSPALANACFYRTDCRLAGLARSAGAAYTRYADDLAFSGGKAFEQRVERFAAHVAAILNEQGFRVQHHKTRIMPRAVKQRLVGLVTNERLNVSRTEFDQLKAILTNCVRYGAETQNRNQHPNFRAHLEGRVGFMESVNPEKARRLSAVFERITWK